MATVKAKSKKTQSRPRDGPVQRGVSAPQVGKTRSRRKAETRGRIIIAARRLFMEKGYQETTLREIARSARVTAGNIFVHFPDKVALLIETMRTVIDEQLEEVMASFPFAADIKMQLLHLPRHFYRFYATDPRLCRQLLKQTYFLDADYVKPLDDQIAVYLHFTAGQIDAAKKRGEIKPGADSSTAAEAYFGYYLKVLFDFLKSPSPDPEKAAAELEKLIDQLLVGIGKQKRK